MSHPTINTQVPNKAALTLEAQLAQAIAAIEAARLAAVKKTGGAA